MVAMTATMMIMMVMLMMMMVMMVVMMMVVVMVVMVVVMMVVMLVVMMMVVMTVVDWLAFFKSLPIKCCFHEQQQKRMSMKRISVTDIVRNINYC